MHEASNNIIFIYYLLKNLQLNNRHIGTSQPLLTQEILNRIECAIPPVEEQNRIASIINLIDEKIQNNIQINDNLAAQIQSLCNAWLTDFIPFNGECPSDWQLTPLSSFANFVSGYSYKGNELQPSEVAMATIKNFDRNGGFKLVFHLIHFYNHGFKEIVPSNKLKPEHHAQLFDTLVAHTDLTQKAEVIGNAEPVLSFSGYQDLIFSMDVVKVTPTDPLISKFLIAAMLKTRQFKEHCLGYVNGTTVLHLSKKALADYSLMLPRNFSILKPLDDAVSAMYRQMSSNIDENSKLSKLRDSLLPRLMSGEIDVSNINI